MEGKNHGCLVSNTSQSQLELKQDLRRGRSTIQRIFYHFEGFLCLLIQYYYNRFQPAPTQARYSTQRSIFDKTSKIMIELIEILTIPTPICLLNSVPLTEEKKNFFGKGLSYGNFSRAGNGKSSLAVNNSFKIFLAVKKNREASKKLIYSSTRLILKKSQSFLNP